MGLSRQAYAALLVAIGACLALAPPAGAATQSTRDGAPTMGPVFAGDRVVWSERVGAAGARIVSSRLRGDRSVIGRFSGAGRGPRARARLAGLAATASSVAAVVTYERPIGPSTDQREPPEDLGAELVAGMLGAPLRVLASGCAPPEGPFEVDASGTRVVSFDTSCARVAVHDLASGESQALAPGGILPRAAGPLTAWLDQRTPEARPAGRLDVVAHDARTGAVDVVFRGNALPGLATDVALQPDGLIAVAFRNEGRHGVVVGRRGEQLRRLALPAGRTPYSVQLSGGNVVAGRRRGGRHQLWAAAAGRRARRLTVDLFDPGFGDQEAFDLEDGRVAWASERCGRFAVNVRTLSSLARRPRPAPRCR